MYRLKRVLEDLPRDRVYQAIQGVCYLSCVVGVVAGACSDPLQGGRGGAVAVAIAFLILFSRSNYGMRNLKLDVKTWELPEDIEKCSPAQINLWVKAIYHRLNIEDDGRERQSNAMAYASFVGTIVWGFGDLMSQYLRTLFILGHILDGRSGVGP